MNEANRRRVIEALRKGSTDPRASPETRAEAERQMRNQLALMERSRND
jgi:hypothetical protein